MDTKKLNVSSSPHFRSRLTTGVVMRDVILALLPAEIAGIYHYGISAVVVSLLSIAAAVLTEFVYDLATKKPNTVKDGSAVLTGLLLALCLPASVPFYIPVIGSAFAILVAKSLFGGLGKNFVNPALAGRCFLMLFFGKEMANYTFQGVSSATPLALLRSGDVVNVIRMSLGNTSGIIGSSVIALLIGGVYLLIRRGITFEIPAAALLSFALFIALFAGQGFEPLFILAHLCGGGIVLGAFFMATDPVTCPVSSTGQLVFGVLVGVLSGIFRVYGTTPDSVSFAILISNLFVPLIDEIFVPLPFAYRFEKEKSAPAAGGKGLLDPGIDRSGNQGSQKAIPKNAMVIGMVVLAATAGIGVLEEVMKEKAADQQLAANAASYQEVVPDAARFAYDDTLLAALKALDGGVYGADFGKVTIDDVAVGVDASGNPVGYAVSVTNADAFDGSMTLSVGIAIDGTVNGIAFTDLHETDGFGMRCSEPAFKDQFAGVKALAFTLNKEGSASADGEINSVSGASRSSGAVVNAVNAAIDFVTKNK